ncbi:hypothetical protein E2C01_062093 [Portunus trituberculatus]|uniref:C-type lectin domain-containing protein n=1 Tax=Portunus trituberculatus TaxID=210409 RepID=A0A5B7HF67_PORTR|nr:hypothetical protein [Portunus trituberculatus]
MDVCLISRSPPYPLFHLVVFVRVFVTLPFLNSSQSSFCFIISLYIPLKPQKTRLTYPNTHKHTHTLTHPQEHTTSLGEAKRRATDEGTLLEVAGGGRLVVGQKLHSLDGDFMFLETLDGEVGEWKIYPEALPGDTMLIFSTCHGAPSLPTPLYDLQDGRLEVVGEASTSNMSLKALCDKETREFHLFFPVWMTYIEARRWCRKLKGSVALPKDSETNALLVDRFIRHRDTCAQTWTHLFWVDAEGEGKEGPWRTTEGELLSFTPFLQEDSAGQEDVQCAAAVSHNRKKWAVSPCQMETCVLCAFNTHPEIRLYGLCDHSSLDRLFSFRDHPKYELIFEGVSHVVLAAQNGSWVMRSRLYPSLKAVMVTQYEGQDPVGVRTWVVEGDRCREKEVRKRNERKRT